MRRNRSPPWGSIRGPFGVQSSAASVSKEPITPAFRPRGGSGVKGTISADAEPVAQPTPEPNYNRNLLA